MDNQESSSSPNESDDPFFIGINSDSIIASCNCLCKSNEIAFHKRGCKYRLICERDKANYDVKFAIGLSKLVYKILSENNLLQENPDIEYGLTYFKNLKQ